jgi:crotonobetainyl-CoA:carnitine CoA-transferase CaiB-like acyl-CoA transferase
MGDRKPMALEGIKVVDWTIWQFGPVAATMLGDMGAEVTKLGPVKLADHPIRYGETPHSIRRLAPELGEHTEEILLELGYDWPDIAQLQEKGVIS